MIDLVWIPIEFGVTQMPKGRFFTCDEYGEVFVGDSARDFWDSMKYWFPMPSFPFATQGFASDEALQAVIRTLNK